MHELQSLLLKKIPRLGELTFGCYVKTDKLNSYRISNPLNVIHGVVYESLESDTTHGKIVEILGHPFTHADILEALGEDWAMTGDYQLLFFPRGHTSMVFGMDMGPQWIEKGITLPRDLSDLSLPEYEETRKKLISLLK